MKEEFVSVQVFDDGVVGIIRLETSTLPRKQINAVLALHSLNSDIRKPNIFQERDGNVYAKIHADDLGELTAKAKQTREYFDELVRKVQEIDAVIRELLGDGGDAR